jgi:hypothetical protein
MRDLVLLHMFLGHLDKTHALSVPAEDLVTSVDLFAERFKIAENGGPGYEEMKATEAALGMLKTAETRLEQLEKDG